MLLKEIKTYFDTLYPEDLKASYDNVGLMVGSLNKDIKKVLLSLDLTREVMDEAISLKVDLIITHHPLLFYPMKMIDLDNDPGSIVRDLIKYDIANFSMHTNFDTVKMNEYLGNLIGIKNQMLLSEDENCGVYGDVNETSLNDYILKVKKAFNIDEARYYGKENITLKTVGIVGGSGSSMFKDAKNKKVDLFITGDVSYSRGVEAKRMGLNVLDVGHFVEHLYTNVVIKDLANLDKSIIVETSKVSPIPYINY